jgi:hypothetical protein
MTPAGIIDVDVQEGSGRAPLVPVVQPAEHREGATSPDTGGSTLVRYDCCRNEGK